METVHAQIIDALGGTTSVARMILVPISTVHGWRKTGIPPSRVDHIKLAAAKAKPHVDVEAIEAAHAARCTDGCDASETGNEPQISAQRQEQAA